MRVNFEYDMHLQYENRALKARIRELESGAAYVRMQKECEKDAGKWNVKSEN